MSARRLLGRPEALCLHSDARAEAALAGRLRAWRTRRRDAHSPKQAEQLLAQKPSPQRTIRKPYTEASATRRAARSHPVWSAGGEPIARGRGHPVRVLVRRLGFARIDSIPSTTRSTLIYNSHDGASHSSTLGRDIGGGTARARSTAALQKSTRQHAPSGPRGWHFCTCNCRETIHLLFNKRGRNPNDGVFNKEKGT